MPSETISLKNSLKKSLNEKPRYKIRVDGYDPDFKYFNKKDKGRRGTKFFDIESSLMPGQSAGQVINSLKFGNWKHE